MIVKKYRLQTVLEIRERAKDEAAQFVAKCLVNLANAEDELSRRQMRLQKCYERQRQAQTALQADLTRGTQARNVIGHQIFLNDLKNLEAEILELIEDQKRVVAKAEREVETAREKLAEAAKNVKVIEKHKENWRQHTDLAENRKSQKISDEIGSILYGRRDKN